MNMHVLTGFGLPWVIYAGLLLLHLVIPARRIDGYVQDPDTGKPLVYHLNGLRVLIVAVCIWASGCQLRWFDWNDLWLHRWASLAGACTLGLIFSMAVVLRAPSTGKAFISDLYLGRLENPQWLAGRVDAKMFLYLVGAVMLELNLLSFAAHHMLTYGPAYNPGVLLHVALFSWFVLDYMVFEHVHVYTYDIFAERVGFKLGWGCLTFYPYFYAVGLWDTAARPDPHLPALALAGPALVFFAGWSLARGANMQKYLFKRDSERAFLGFMQPVVLEEGGRRLLCSGFWRVSRHVNYLGEILMALGLALCLGWPSAIGPWLYPLYYVALLLPRERDDDRRCAQKYGALWKRYVQAVPRRIVPGVY